MNREPEKYNPDLTVSNHVDPPKWFRRVPVLLEIWYNPLFQREEVKSSKNRRFLALVRGPGLFLFPVLMVVMAWFPVVQMMVMEKSFGFSQPDDPDFLIPALLIEFPMVFLLGLCLGIGSAGILGITKKYERSLNPGQPDPLMATSLSDRDAFLAVCYSRIVELGAFGVSGIIVSVIMTVTAMLFMIPPLGTYFTNFGVSIALIGGPPGLLFILLALILNAVLIAIMLPATMVSYMSDFHPMLASIATILDAGLFIFIARFVVNTIIRFVDPGYVELFMIGEMRMGDGFYHVLYLVMFAAILFIWTRVTLKKALKQFTDARRGLTGG